MKNTLLLLILLLGVSLMNACTPKDNCTISGTLTGLTDGTVLELLPGATHKKEKPLAETTVSGGKFSFTVQAPTPRLFYINQQGIKGTLTVVASNGE